MNGKRSIGQMPVLRRHAGLCAVERLEENDLWACIVLLLQGIHAAAAVVSMLHPVMMHAFDFIHQLIAVANLYRVHVWEPHRDIDKVYFFGLIIYSFDHLIFF